MLTKSTTAVLKALHVLTSQPGWLELDKFLENELQATYVVLAEAADEATLRAMQGRARFIREFKKFVKDAPSVLDKLGGSSL